MSVVSVVSVVATINNNSNELEDDPSLLFDKKKKRKSKIAPPATATAAEVKAEDSEPDHTYEFLLKRLYSLHNSMSKDRLRIVPPIVGMDGGKRTCISNFGQICDGINRDCEHLSLYISIEFFTPVSLNPERKLTLRGKFRPEQVEHIIRNYVSKYLVCQACKTYNTNLVRESRLHFIKCLTCQSQRSVEPLRPPTLAKKNQEEK